MTQLLTGTCVCGNVEYQVADEFRYALICHCSQCRRATGAANKPFAGIEREKLVLIRGGDRVFRYGGDDTHDVRCRTCGSLLYSVVRDGHYVHVALGSLGSAPTTLPTAHIFVGSKASWESITDSLPQHRELP